MHTRKRLAWGFFALALLARVASATAEPVAESPSRASQPARPNVLLILADDLGFSDLGCYGGEIQTPRLDALAREGLRFTQFYNTARCWPTRAAILTGYYAQQVRRDAVPGIAAGARASRPQWAPLLPHRLASAGYRSYHSGKWHIDGPVLAGGFLHAYSLNDHGRYFSPKGHTLDDKPQPAVERGTGYYATTAIADFAIQCLKDHAKDHAGQPFFQYVAFTAPHFPLHALPEDIERYRDRYTQGWERTRAERWERVRKMGLVGGELSPVEREIGSPYPTPKTTEWFGEGEVQRPLPWEELTDSQRKLQAAKMAVHAAMVDRMDREIGRILDQVRAQGAWENTLVIFCSDNGATAELLSRDDGHDLTAAPGSAATHLCLGAGWAGVSNTPFRRHKTWVHEGGISTPLIAHWPAGIRAKGELRRTPGHVIDLVPTVLELAGVEARVWGDDPQAPPLPSKSLTPVFDADAVQPAPRELWWSHEGNKALRVGDWKVVMGRPAHQWELFDLSKDRTETHNLAAAQPERLRAMVARWEELDRAHTEQAQRGATPAEPTKKKKKQ